MSDHPVTYKEVSDSFESHTVKSQRLSQQLAALTKIGMTTLMTTMAWGTFGLSGIMGAMSSAGFSTLCGNAAVCLVEQDGDHTKAIQELGKQKIVEQIARSMVQAGMVHGITGQMNLPKDVEGKVIKDLNYFAKTALVNSAVSTSLALAIDKTPLKEALLQPELRLREHF